jgi:D-inositol-3-phosphate glycosyltransferase
MIMTSRRIATLTVHTSPFDQAETGDAGGMNICPCEAVQNMAAMGMQAASQVNWSG